MVFHGVDFSSAPSSMKPIVIVSANGPVADCVTKIHSLTEFETWLKTAEGIVGIDSPFGYPVEFCGTLFPEMDWNGIAKELGRIAPDQSLRVLEERVTAFREVRPLGTKEPKRLTDQHSNAFSSMKFGRPPVGRMAARLLPILERSAHSILPVRPKDSQTTVVEVFPGKLVRDAIGRESYKAEKGNEEIRQTIFERLGLKASPDVREAAIRDSEGDVLDALIAVDQIRAWYSNGCQMPTLPITKLEGWII
ncbi:MAG: DUF429 domain-containing protein [Armatimonadota bacterium]